METSPSLAGEIISALSAPVTKLIAVVAAGCGRVYGPTEVRRLARAQGDALVIMEQAKARVSEVAVLAAQRLLDIEERRQSNIDAIVMQARLNLPNEVSDRPVDPDWAARFFADCQDVGNAQMQAAWARLLAGEVAKPKSFSQRTIQTLKNLTVDEAQLFNRLSSRSLRHANEHYPFIGFEGQVQGELAIFQFRELRQLDDAGLISFQPMGLSLQGSPGRLFFEGPTYSLMIESDRTKPIPVGVVAFTVAGTELASICEWAPDEDSVQGLASRLVALGHPAKCVRNLRFENGLVAWDELQE